MTRYRAEWFENGWWQSGPGGVFDTLTKAEIYCNTELGGYNHTRVVPVEEPK